jgi:hypothetical protein
MLSDMGSENTRRSERLIAVNAFIGSFSTMDLEKVHQTYIELSMAVVLVLGDELYVIFLSVCTTLFT